MSDHDKIQVLVSKLDMPAYEGFNDQIMPKTLDLCYDEAKEILESLFRDQFSIFERKYDVFRLHIGDRRYNQLASTINRVHSLAKTDHMTKEQFKCFSFVSALKGEKHVETKQDC